MTVENGGKPSTIKDLKPKMPLAGVVKRVELFGAFVDVGVGRDGILHISQLSRRNVRNVTDIVKEGDTVNVWVRNVDLEKNRIELTLIEPAAVEWDEIKAGDTVTGKVTRIENFGVFVDIGAERDARIHVSELANGFVRNPADVVKVGDEVNARVLNVNKAKRQIDLSIKALDAEPQKVEVFEESTNEPLPTAMELALRQAMAGTEMEDDFPRRASGSKKKKKRGRHQLQDDIIARTLQHRQK